MRQRAVWLFFLGVLLSSGVGRAEEMPEAPPLGHPASRVLLELGSSEALGPFVSAAFRFGLHDLLDARDQYPTNTVLEIFSAKLRFNPRDTSAWVDDLAFVRLLSLPNMLEAEREWSWSFEVGMRTVREAVCDHCLAGGVRSGLGFSLESKSKTLLAYFLMEGELSYAPNFARFALQPALVPHLGLRLAPSERFTLWAGSRYFYQPFNQTAGSFTHSLECRWAPLLEFALNARLSRLHDGWESGLSLLHYF